MIQKIQMLILAVILLLTGYTAQSQDALLWKISGNGLNSSSYLYGTIHIICPDDMVRMEDLKKLVGQTDQLVMEVDMDSPETMQKIQLGSVNPGMKNIKGELTEDQQKMINQFLNDKFGMGLDQLGVLKPWALAVMISTNGVIECDNKTGYEMLLMKTAQEKQKEIFGLETVEFQLSMFDKISRDDQLKMLTDAIEKKPEYDKMLRELIQLYKEESIEKIHEQSLESSPSMKKYADLLLYKRNNNWIANMEKFMKEKPTLFTVGAAHLGGNKGILNLLKKAGYKMEAVR